MPSSYSSVSAADDPTFYTHEYYDSNPKSGIHSRVREEDVQPLTDDRSALPPGSYGDVVSNSKSASQLCTRSAWSDGWWWWEMASMLVAIACLISIVALLSRLQDRPIPRWPSGLSVNAVLSVLVTVMKGSMAVVIAESLSQLKWSWFRRKRRLHDMVVFDQASRGVLGAGKLLFTIRSWYLAYIGALILIAAFIIGPTVQQCVEIRVRQVALRENATAPICNNTYYEVIGLGPGPGLNRVKLSTAGAIYNGLLQTSSRYALDPYCPSGNCTFPVYQSLGVCSQCTDSTSKLIYRDSKNKTITASQCANATSGYCVAEWPGYAMTLSTGQTITSNITGPVNFTTSINFKTDPAIHGFAGIMSAEVGSYSPRTAVECSLRFCVNTYKASVRSGAFIEELISSSHNGSYYNSTQQFWQYQGYLIMPADPCYIDGVVRSKPWSKADEEACTYSVYGGQGKALENTLATHFTKGLGYRQVSNRPGFSSDALMALYGLLDANMDSKYPDIASFNTVNRAFNSLADVLTNHARGSPGVCGDASVTGTQWTDELYLHVKWVWLAPTAGLLIACLVFFVVTMIRSAGQDLWKSSPLAFVMHRPRATDENWTNSYDMTVFGDPRRTKSEMQRMKSVSKRTDVWFERHHHR